VKEGSEIVAVSVSSDSPLRLLRGSQDSGPALEVGAFLADCEMRALSANTLRIYMRQLAAFRVWANNTPASDVTPQMLRSYFLSLQSAGHNAGGQHQAYRVLKTFFRWLRREGMTPANPMARIKPPQLREEPLEPVSLDTVKAMLRVCQGKSLLDWRDTALLLTLLDTGARAHELLAVNLADVDMGAGVIMLRETKSRKIRAAFVGARTRKALTRYVRARGELAQDAPLWATDAGGRLAYAGLRQMLRRRATQAGVKAPGAHAFRWAFCLAMLRGGADVFAVQKLAGHADLATTRRYLKQVQDDLQAAHKKAAPVDRWEL